MLRGDFPFPQDFAAWQVRMRKSREVAAEFESSAAVKEGGRGQRGAAAYCEY